MTTRKSQLEKFNSRLSKMKTDDVIVREAEAKKAQEESKPEVRGAKLLSESNISDDIFAVITQSGAEGFTKLWANSVETAVAGVLNSDEFRGMIREIVRTEIVGAVQGVVSGINHIVQTGAQTVVEETVQHIVKEEVKDELIKSNESIKKTELPKDDSLKKDWKARLKSISIHVDSPLIERTDKGSIKWRQIEDVKPVFFMILEECEKKGLDINKSSQLQGTRGDAAAMYSYINNYRTGKTMRQVWSELLTSYENSK